MSGESDEQQHDRRIGVSQGLPAAAPAAIALAAVLETAPIRFVHVGSASGPDITLPGAALRSSAITLTGSGIGSIPLDRIVKSIGELLRATVPGGFAIVTRTFPLCEVERVWAEADSMARTVFQMP